MNSESRIKSWYGFFIFVALVTIDQFSKYLIRHFGGFYVCNPNISWGISVSEYIFWILWLAIIVVLLLLLFKKGIIYNSYFLVLVLSGAISNMIDRFHYGCVVDFINLKFWPVFNLADIFIVIGALLLLAKRKKI